MARDEEIRLIAYNLWEEEGCLHGQDHEHWLKAEAIWEQQQQPKTAEKSSKVGSKQVVEKKKKVMAAKKKQTK